MHQRAAALSLIILFMNVLFMASIEPAATVTWSEQPVELPTHESFDGYPSITQIANGTIYVVWTRQVISTPKIFYMTSSDHGDTWSDEKNLTDIDDEYKDVNPSITQTMNGTIWMVWSSNRPPPTPPPEPDFSLDASPENPTIAQGDSDNSTIIVTSLYDFSEPVNLTVIIRPENVTTTLDPPQVTPPPNGTANSTLTVSVNSTATPGNYTIVVEGKSSGERHLVTIRLEVIESSTLAHESTPSAISARSENPEESNTDRIYYKTSHDGGATWSNATQLEPSSTSNDRAPSMVQDMNGTLWIAWASDRTGNDDIFYKNSTDGGTSWSDTYTLTTDPDGDRSPSITQTMDGRIWVAWSSCRTGNSEVLYRTYNGTSWSNAMNLTDSTNIDTTPSILQTFDGTLWIFWASCEDSATARADIFYKYSTDNGVHWSDRIQFTTDLAEDTWPSTTQARDVKTWVVWASNRTGNMDLFCRTSLAGDITGPTNDPDGVIDEYDLDFICNAYGDKNGDSGWNEIKTADLTGPEDPPASRRFPPDGIIDIHDLAVAGKNYGET